MKDTWHSKKMSRGSNQECWSPDWMGVRKPYKAIADRLAQMGYIAFVADIYGKGVRPSNSQDASAEAQKYKSDRKLLRQRVLAGLE